MLQLLNLVYAVCIWESERLNQIVDVPVPQIEEECEEAKQLEHQEREEAKQSVPQERVEANQLVPQERTQQHINEPIFIVWNGITNLYSEKMMQV